MFTGIIEHLGTVTHIVEEGTNVHITIDSPISKELKIDQSLAHSGVCLTVTAQDAHKHTVTAIEETLLKTNLGDWTVGTKVNLERAMVAGARLDGHMVQGHVDTTGVCIGREDKDGSWLFTFQYKPTPQYLLVDKGSVCVNGVSLTVVSPTDDTFSVAIIPYTFEHTTFQDIHVGTKVNLEFDIIGKYMARYFEAYKGKLLG
ncbi:MAG: riboflavin synthase [Saprospiraceae bacterium]|nr:riboflavin synthase [Saprospiraceae bacterium]